MGLPWPARLASGLGIVAAVVVVAAGVLVAPSPRTSRATAGALVGSHPVIGGVAFGDDLPALSPAALDAALDDVGRLHATWIRMDFSWADIEPAPTRYDWTALDRVVAAASRRGLHILATLGYTPAWARAPRCASTACPPASPRVFVEYATAVVGRYAARGVHTWEIWNEPNSAGFWAPEPDPRAYATLVVQTSARIHALDRSAVTMIGGLAATVTRPGEIDTRQFVRDLCRYGVPAVVDALSYHPYTYPFPASYTGSATAWTKISDAPGSLGDILASCGAAGLPIWITEYGAPTRGSGPAAASDHGTGTDTHVTEAWQAALATDAVTTAERTPSVAALFWYTARDSSDGDDVDGSYGLRRADGTAKPAFDALARALAAGSRS